MPRVAASENPSCGQVARNRQHGLLVAVVDADEDAALLRQPLPGAHHRLAERRAEVVRAAHHLAGGLHLRPEDRVDAREADEREHRALDEHAVPPARSSTSPSSASVRPAATRAAIFAIGTPVAFEMYGTVRDDRGLTSST